MQRQPLIDLASHVASQNLFSSPWQPRRAFAEHLQGNKEIGSSHASSLRALEQQCPLVHTVFGTSWRTLAQLSPSTVTADNQYTVGIDKFVHKTVESSLQRPEEFASSVTCRLDSTVLCANMPISTAHWLSAVTVEGDDWTSLLQEATRLLPRRTGFDPRRGRSRIFARGNRSERCRWSAGFLGNILFLPAHLIRRCSILISRHPHRLSRQIWATDEGEWRRVWITVGLQGRGGREIPDKTRRPAPSSGTIPTCENPGVTPPGIKPGSPRWEASSLTTTPPQPLTAG
ncbi:hypothetical protein PR048_003514 [Dryococelus australis]|uniref:Uncharacterized protein n=1 Tax=Dryococelus australis TaxID=614101 RepID=A0ABQ9INA0_9NEOP|nr:hypothetical protein PR048_003514 [Dryococelus australis]